MEKPVNNLKSQSNPDGLLAEVPNIPYKVRACWPHDPTAFTEGLVFQDGTLYESTGPDPPPRSISTLRQVEISSGRILKIRALRPQYFAEGLTIFHDRIFQLTLRSRKGFVYDLETFSLLDTFYYEGEGWGLTHDEKYVIMSNGSYSLQIIDPDTLEMEDATIDVCVEGRPLRGLNELEYIDGLIYANVFMTDYIFRIDPKDGKVLGRLDLSGLRPSETANCENSTLNGIAYDPTLGNFFVTGKNWPTMFEIRLISDRS